MSTLPRAVATVVVLSLFNGLAPWIPGLVAIGVRSQRCSGLHMLRATPVESPKELKKEQPRRYLVQTQRGFLNVHSEPGDPYRSDNVVGRLFEGDIVAAQEPLLAQGPFFQLQGIDLQVEAGSTTAIISQEGQGKSSLLLAILGEMAMKSGHFSGSNAPGGGRAPAVPETAMTARQLLLEACSLGGRKIAVAPQEPWLFAGTLRSNILFGLDMNNSIYESVLQACALKLDLQSMPSGDLTEIAAGGSTISGGQRARVGLARAAYRAALEQEARHVPLVVLDDPFCALDKEVAVQVCKSLLSQSTGLLRHSTVLVAAADPWWLSCLVESGQLDAGIVILRSGSVLTRGRLSELLGQDLPELKTVVMPAEGTEGTEVPMRNPQDEEDEGELPPERQAEDAAPRLPPLPMMMSPPKSIEAETQTPLTKEQEIKGALASEEGAAECFARVAQDGDRELSVKEAALSVKTTARVKNTALSVKDAVLSVKGAALNVKTAVLSVNAEELRARAAQPQADLQSDPQEILNQLEESGLFRGDEQLLAQLRLLAAEGVHPLDALQGNFQQEEEPRDPMLQSFDVAGMARYIQDHKCQNIVVLCGAGISTSAGIPDFRTPGSGLYDNLQRFNLTEPESIFNLDFFQKEPGPFYELCRDLWPGRYQPTIGHHFIRLLETKGLLRRCYTQNIDSLERQAGVSPEKIVAAHGNMDEAHVVGTQRSVEVDELRQAIFAGEKGWRALAATHGGLPSVVMFGEDLPDRFWDLQDEDLRKCDLMIVIGTSLVVEPFASLVGKVSPTAPRLLINREPSGTCDKLLFGFRFHLPQLANWRDVWFEGSCDEGCVALATALGWEKELRKLQAQSGADS
eukprot:s2098_g2.t2